MKLYNQLLTYKLNHLNGELSVKRHKIILLWESFLHRNSRIRPKNFAKFHFCTCLLIQILHTNITDMSFTQQTVFHSIGGRKKLRNFFPFSSLQDSCSQEGLAQPWVKWLSNGTDFIPLKKHSPQPRNAQCCWNSPDKQETLFLAIPFTDIKLLILQDTVPPVPTEMEYNLGTGQFRLQLFASFHLRSKFPDKLMCVKLQLTSRQQIFAWEYSLLG